MLAVQIFFIECLPYILKSSKEAHRPEAPHAPPPMFITLFLERMGKLSATKSHVLLYLERFTHVLIHYSEKQLSQTILCSKYDFQIVQIQKFQKNYRKSIVRVKVFRYLTILVVATHGCTIKKLF